jgi:hypothetical protein
MSWLVDNANTFYVLLGVVAAGFVVTWRFNQRVKFLGYAAGTLCVIGLLWLITVFVWTDCKQLKSNVDAMADAVVQGKVDDLFKHISKDFVYKGMTREMLYEAARRSIKGNKISNIRITQFNVEEISRDKKFAKVKFNVTAWDAQGETPYPFTTKAEFVLEGEEWELKTMKFFKTFVDTDQEIAVPGL